MIKLRVLKYDLELKYDWQCPECKELHLNQTIRVSPYTALNNNMHDVHCEKCHTFYSLTL